ncbi:ABC transporter permease [Streptomyces albidoflavus]
MEDVAPLADGDMSGTAVLFAGMGMMLAGYVPLSLMTMSLPYLLRLRRFLPLALGWSVLTSTVIWTILGPVVGAVDGHYLEFLGIGLLATGAVALTQLLFTKLVGPLAVLFGMLLWVVFGMPSSGLSLSIHTMPGFFQFLHGVLPLPAAGEALRSLLYFDGRGLGSHLLTLAVWALAALALCLLKERRSGHAIPAAPAVDGPGEPLPALAGGPVRAPRTRYVAAVLFPLSILVAVVGLMGASMHKPEVRGMPVAVVGATEQQARQAVAGLEPGLGAMFDLRPVGSVREATAQLTGQEVAGAYVLPTAEGGGAELLTASAAGPSRQTILRSVFRQVAEKQDMALETRDVRPLTGDDTMGSNSLYVAMSWIMAGFLIMAVLRGGAPELRRFRQFLPLLAGWAVGMVVWLWFLFDVLIGAVNGHAGVLIGAGAATIFCVALAAGAFTRTVGLAAIVPVMIVLMLLGVPASGGGLPVSMVPEIFRTLQDVLPLPAAVDIARSLVYFDSAGLGGNLLTIAAWGGAGLVLNLLADLWLAHRARQGKGIPAEVPRAGGARSGWAGGGRGAAGGGRAGGKRGRLLTPAVLRPGLRRRTALRSRAWRGGTGAACRGLSDEVEPGAVRRGGGFRAFTVAAACLAQPGCPVPCGSSPSRSAVQRALRVPSYFRTSISTGTPSVVTTGHWHDGPRPKLGAQPRVA